MSRSDTLLAPNCRLFLLVAETGSVRAAARQSNTAASAISRQISLLEESLGVKLFDRGGRTMRLSPSGEELLHGLMASNLVHEQTLDQINALRGLKSGRIRIATVESISVSILPSMLQEFTRQHPGLQTLVTVAGSDAVTELVRGHNADVGMTFNPTGLDGLEVVDTVDLQLGAVMAPRHALSRLETVSLRQCLQHPVAWPAPGLSLRTLLDPMVRQLKISIKPSFECNSLRVMAGLAANGACVAFQTVVGIERELAEGTLIFVPLSDKRLPADRLMLLRRQGLDGRTAANAFVEHARRHFSDAEIVLKNRTRRGK